MNADRAPQLKASVIPLTLSVMDKPDVIAAVCHALSDNGDAVRILNNNYPFAPAPITRRKYGPVQSTRVFVRDGFIDRYSGHRLIFPPVFRVLSIALPTDFPYHPNWKTDVTHPAYWELGATIDHLNPVTRGGADDESNWITTSMAHNFAKMNWTLDECNLNLFPGGHLNQWDGLIHWFVDYTATNPDSLANSSVRQWLRAAKLVLSEIAV